MLSRYIFLVVAAFSFQFLATAQETTSVLDKVIAKNDSVNLYRSFIANYSEQSTGKRDSLSVNGITQTSNNFYKAIKKQLQVEDKINGVLGFALSLQSSDNQDLSQFTISAKGNRGSYPGEFKFDSKIVAQVQDGKFIENLSNLSMSYDHHLGRSLASEGYIFLKRSTNNFLNIDQRYEVGGGVVWNVFLSGKDLTLRENKILAGNQDAKKEKIDRLRRHALTKEGVALFSALRDYEIKNKRLSEGKTSDDRVSQENFLNSLNLVDAKAAEREQLKKDIKRSLYSVLKEKSKVRVSLLGGINYETERTTDSLKLRFKTDSIRSRSFNALNLVRAVIAPGIELKIDKFEMKSRLYFKLAVSNNDFINRVTEGSLKDEKVDYRLEFVNKASLTFNKNIKIVGVFNFVEINAPRRAYFEIEGSNQLFIAARRFVNFTVGFEYKL